LFHKVPQLAVTNGPANGEVKGSTPVLALSVSVLAIVYLSKQLTMKVMDSSEHHTCFKSCAFTGKMYWFAHPPSLMRRSWHRGILFDFTRIVRDGFAQYCFVVDKLAVASWKMARRLDLNCLQLTCIQPVLTLCPGESMG
jgi:hypothetical protein